MLTSFSFSIQPFFKKHTPPNIPEDRFIYSKCSIFVCIFMFSQQAWEQLFGLCGRTAGLISQETATAALLKWGYFTDNQRFVKAPVSGQMKELTPQGRNCCLFFLQLCAGSPPPPSPSLSLSLPFLLWLCPHAPKAPCQSLFTELVLGWVSAACFLLSFPPVLILATLLCLKTSVVYLRLLHFVFPRRFLLSSVSSFINFLFLFFSFPLTLCPSFLASFLSLFGSFSLSTLSFFPSFSPYLISLLT